MTGERLSDTRPDREPTPSGPRIYAASLSDYNSGVLHGQWIDAGLPVDDQHEHIAQMLDRSPTAARTGQPAEEWAIHDYEGFGLLHLSEYETIEHIARVGQGIVEHGPAFAAWANLIGIAEDIDLFEDAYRGHYGSREEYGEQLAEDFGICQAIDDLPEIVRSFITVEPDRVIRDMELSGDIHLTEAEDGGVHVFDARG